MTVHALPGASGKATSSTAAGAFPQEGEVLGGRFALGRVIGAGGMATVREAVDLRLRRSVAVKILATADDEPSRRAAAVEMRALACFDHPNLVRLFDADVDAGLAYLVMELVDGPNLAERCRNGPMPEGDVLRVAAAMADALAYVHSRGIVHRDVKPANVLLGSHARVLLADFGIAQLVDTAGVTASGLVAGTPAYLSAEQVVGGPVGPPADVFALALVLAECFSGARVYSGSADEMMAARLHTRPEFPGPIPSRFRPVLSAMTRVEPELRPTASELVGVFGGVTTSRRVWPVSDVDTRPLLIAEAPTRSHAVVAAPASLVKPPGAGKVGSGRLALRRPRGRAVAATAAAVALIAVALVSDGWLSGTSLPVASHSKAAPPLRRPSTSAERPATVHTVAAEQLQSVAKTVPASTAESHAGPAVRHHPGHGGNQGGPGQQGGPAQPGGPVKPGGPAQPGGPVKPGGPGKPGGPAQAGPGHHGPGPPVAPPGP